MFPLSLSSSPSATLSFSFQACTLVSYSPSLCPRSESNSCQSLSAVLHCSKHWPPAAQLLMDSCTATPGRLLKGQQCCQQRSNLKNESLKPRAGT